MHSVRLKRMANSSCWILWRAKGRSQNSIWIIHLHAVHVQTKAWQKRYRVAKWHLVSVSHVIPCHADILQIPKIRVLIGQESSGEELWGALQGLFLLWVIPWGHVSSALHEKACAWGQIAGCSGSECSSWSDRGRLPGRQCMFSASVALGEDGMLLQSNHACCNINTTKQSHVGPESMITAVICADTNLLNWVSSQLNQDLYRCLSPPCSSEYPSRCSRILSRAG